MVYFLMCDGEILGTVSRYVYSPKFGQLVNYTTEDRVEITGLNMDRWNRGYINQLTIEAWENPYSDYRE